MLNPLKSSGKVFLSILILVLAFPQIDATYTIGLDPSYYYAMNYFVNSKIQFGRDVFCTYGPLVFIDMPAPLGNNLAISLIIISLVFVTFSYTILTLGQVINRGKWLLHLGIAFLACQLFFIEDMLAGITAISILLYLETPKWKWMALAVITSLFGLYIKPSVGISCFLLLVSYCAIYWFMSHDFRKVLKITGSSALLYFIFWFCIYRNFGGSLGYLWSTYQLTKEYSSAISAYPENHWWLIGIGLLSFSVIPLIDKDKKVRVFYALFFLSVFAAWKHSYSREEELHLSQFYDYLILFFLLFFIYVDNIKIRHVFLIALSCIGIYSNMQLTGRYHIDDRVSLNKFSNFSEILFNYKGFAEKTLTTSEENVESKKLPDEVLNMVGNKTIDFYPNELSYVAANKLNWKPRPIIQSYNAYTEWLDNRDAQYFASDSSSQFILWEYSSDRWGENNFGEIDNRYALNDEPNALYQLLNHYSAIYKNSTFILFKKENGRNLAPPKEIASESATWNQWIKVPGVDDGILRARMTCHGNLLRFVKSLLYKDEEFYMECKLANGNVVKYRIIPENARRGLWINPLFVNNLDKYNVPYSIVEEVRFTCSNTKLMQDKINVAWDVTDIINRHDLPAKANKDNEYDGKFRTAYRLFMEDERPAEKLVFQSLNDFESRYEHWSYNDSSITREKSLSGKKSERMDAHDMYSSVFSIPINDLIKDSASLMIDASAWFKLSGNANGVLVIQMNDTNGCFFWKARSLKNYVNDKNEWEQVFAEEKIPVAGRKNVLLRIYILNDKSQYIWIDDFDVKLYSCDQK